MTTNLKVGVSIGNINKKPTSYFSHKAAAGAAAWSATDGVEDSHRVGQRASRTVFYRVDLKTQKVIICLIVRFNTHINACV